MRIPIVIVLLLAAGCEKPAAPTDRTGLVSWQWSGALQGETTAPGSARWCGADSLLEVMAVDSATDHGLGFSLLTPDSLAAAQHPVVAGSVAANWRPLGFAAFRWVSDTALKGFEATGGTIAITATGPGTVTGTIDLRLRLSQGIDTLAIRGTFDAVSITPASEPCGRLTKIRKG